MRKAHQVPFAKVAPYPVSLENFQSLQHTGAIYSGYFMDDQQHLDRIHALTRNARSSWFALLAALVFVAITLMGLENIDFYGVDRATKLL